MRFLLSNDDGIATAGMALLEEVAAETGEVLISNHPIP